MMVAARVGKPVFATGGIGGVHRYAQETFDISEDLQELAKTRVAVVCTGPKIILDLPLTREYLETIGVPILGYHTDYLPAFYCRNSGLKVDHRCDSSEDIARIIHTQQQLNVEGGLLITNPVPEDFALSLEPLEAMIEKAQAEARAQHIHGKDLTPFLLKQVFNLTGGKSLQTNIQLLKSNVGLAAQIAAKLASQ